MKVVLFFVCVLFPYILDGMIGDVHKMSFIERNRLLSASLCKKFSREEGLMLCKQADERQCNELEKLFPVDYPQDLKDYLMHGYYRVKLVKDVVTDKDSIPYLSQHLMAFAQDDRFLISGDTSGKLHIFDLFSPQIDEIQTIEVGTSPVVSIVISPDQLFMAVVTLDGRARLYIYLPGSGYVEECMVCNFAATLIFSSDSRVLYVGSKEDASVIMYDIEHDGYRVTVKERHRFNIHAGRSVAPRVRQEPVSSLVISGGGQSLLITSGNAIYMMHMGEFGWYRSWGVYLSESLTKIALLNIMGGSDAFCSYIFQINNLIYGVGFIKMDGTRVYGSAHCIRHPACCVNIGLHDDEAKEYYRYKIIVPQSLIGLVDHMALQSGSALKNIAIDCDPDLVFYALKKSRHHAVAAFDRSMIIYERFIDLPESSFERLIQLYSCAGEDHDFEELTTMTGSCPFLPFYSLPPMCRMYYCKRGCS